jgi:hypothetical protein
MIREYDVTYTTKEYLMNDGWEIIAYNPPGSQGTFTITNPNKDHSYRGQDGSLSPDIVAYKFENNKNIFIIVEAKPKYCRSDVDKMINMFKDSARRKIFLKLVTMHARANGFNINLAKPTKILFAKAHGGKKELRKDVSTFYIELKNKKWDPLNINPKQKITDNFLVQLYI